MDLGTAIARVVLHEGDQPNVLTANFRKLAQKELESEYVCPNSPFPEDEMYSIQLQMVELGEPKHRKHTCPYPAQNICQTLINVISQSCLLYTS